MLILLGLGLLWAAVLVPPMVRSRAAGGGLTGPSVSAQDGIGQLDVYHTRPVVQVTSSPPRTALAARRRTLTGKHRAEGLKAAYETFRGADGRLPSTWEVVYGVAWRPERAVSAVSDGIGVPVRLGD